jgi:PAS domain S-box-containing protein
MGNEVKILMVEDSPDDALLLVREIKRGGYEPSTQRVQTAEDLQTALEKDEWDLVISDYYMPNFDGLEALRVVREFSSELPFIIVSGAVGEDLAVDVVLKGAQDYIMKDNLKRLVPAVRRELSEYNEKKKHHETALKLQESREELSLRNRIQEIFFLHPGREMYSEVLKVVLGALESEMGLFGFIDEAGDLVCPSLTEEVWDQCQMPDKALVLSKESWKGIWGRAMTEHQTLFSNEPMGVPEGHVAIEKAVAVPILHDGSPIGLFMVGNRPEPYTKKDLARLESIAYYIAPTMSARIERDAKEAAREKALGEKEEALLKADRRATETSALLECAQAVLEIQDFAEAAKKAFELSQQATGATAGYIALASASGTENKVLAMNNHEARGAVALNIPKPVRLLRAEVYATGSALYENDVPAPAGPQQAPVGHMNLRNVLFAPLFLGSTPAGMLCLANKDSVFSDNDLRVATAFAEMIALALRNAQAVESVEASEGRFRRLSEQAPDMIWRTDPQGTVTYINCVAETMLGYPTEEAIGKPINSCFTAESIERITQWIREALTQSTASPTYKGEVEYIRGDGSTFPAELHSVIVRDKNGRIVAYEGVSRDISERIEAEARLRESEKRFRELFDNMSSGVAIYKADEAGSDFVFYDLNKAGEQISKIPKEEVLGKSLTQVFPGIGKHGLIEALQRVNQTGIPETIEPFHYRDDRLSHWTRNYVFKLDSGEVVAVYDDITEQKNAETENALLEAKLRNKQKLESVGTLARGVAHEINNPINAIMNFAELIQERTDSNPKLVDYAERIVSETERVATIVRTLMSFASQEETSFGEADVPRLARETISLVVTALRKDQIHFDVEMPQELPKIRCIGTQVQQVLMNLMTNARDALNERYPEFDPNKKLNLKIQVVHENGKTWIRSTVEDSAGAMDSDIIDQVFDPFFTTKSREIGTGLGLYISMGIAKDHQGNLWCENRPGACTKFHFDLPIAQNGNEFASSAQGGNGHG